METILIPRVSVLTKDKEIFSNLTKFSAVTGYVPITSASICETDSIRKESRLSNFLRSLRSSVLRPSRGDYNIISNEEHEYAIISSEIRSEMSESKKALVKLIKKHETALLALRDARIQCWKSKAKTEKYQLIIETQKSALKYNQHERKMRTTALKSMEIVLDKWMATHEKDHISFETKLHQEITYREKIQRISAHIKIDIIGKLDKVIRNLMHQNKQDISDRHISKLACQLYRDTCRSYVFGLVKNDPCQKEWIEKPKYENSIMNGTDIEKKIQSPKRMSAK